MEGYRDLEAYEAELLEAGEGYGENEVVELLVERSRYRARSTGSVPVVAHDVRGRVVIFDRDTPLSFRLQPGQVVRARIAKVFEKFYVAIPLAVVQSEARKPTLRTVLRLISRLSQEEKRRLLGLLGLPRT